MQRGLILLFLLAAATPAIAQPSIPIPEPSDFALFALAVAGLIIGRQSSRKPPRDDNHDA